MACHGDVNTARYAVEVRNVNRTFVTKAVRGKSKKETVRALNDVSLTINEGELFGLLGPNGAGKTTLIKILCTLLLPSSGEARVLGHDVTREANAIRQRINMVSGGETSGYGLLTVRENIWLFSQLYGIPTKEANRRIDMLMKELKLEHKKNAKVGTLSTGLRQKANMVRGFLTDPDLIFLDEPTLGLDVNASRLIRDFVKNWMKEDRTRTLLLTTHYMMEADELCDRVAIINDGRVLACDTPHNLKRMLHKDAVLTLEIRQVDDVSHFQSIPGVRSFAHEQDLAAGSTRLKFILDDDSIVADIVAAVPKSGSKIISVEKTEPTLEDVFVTLVGRGLTSHEV